MSYDDLDIFQWVAGYAGIVKDELDGETKHQMLDHLIELMEDAHDFSWLGSKAAHAVVLTKMEDCRVEWEDTHKLERIRRQNQRLDISENKSNSDLGKHSNLCKFYQRDACHAKGDHRSGSKTYRHLCAVCYSFNKELPHKAKDCPELKNKSKNGQFPTLAR